MKFLTLLIVLSYVVKSFGQNCWIEGECTGSAMKSVNKKDRRDCLEECQQTGGCEWFTWYNDGFCALFDKNCTSSIDTSCSGFWCQSGERDCSVEDCPAICSVQGQCSSTVLDTEIVADEAECAERICQTGNPDCQFYTFDGLTKVCFIYDENCWDSSLDKTCASCFTGENECGHYCHAAGSCRGVVEGNTVGETDEAQCIQECKNDPDCLYYTYDTDGSGLCVRYSSCDFLDTSCTTCYSGEKECSAV